ncbi:hypothetical protein DFH08DRAFT_41093 [Mycena albidolilacea]|uniref:Uncharacterized protein n=1 Tax=Mycena albidolilacea TaxID=1033008 RepID=A0AAD7ABA6_9AGAR|nr:hypothetical protein DFH08DRAFT_41093 [Mycena albidolilacea]
MTFVVAVLPPSLSTSMLPGPTRCILGARRFASAKSSACMTSPHAHREPNNRMLSPDYPATPGTDVDAGARTLVPTTTTRGASAREADRLTAPSHGSSGNRNE